MKMNNLSKNLLIIQIVTFFISSVSICFMPFGSYYDGKKEKVIALILGLVFWIFLIVGIFLNFIIAKFGKGEKVKGRWGIACFFKNKYSKIFDVILAVSLLISLLIIIFKSASYIGAVILFIFIFSFEMHCILNGKHFNDLLLAKTKNINS